MSLSTSPVAKRTRLQWHLHLQGLTNGTTCSSLMDQCRKRNREVVDLDDYWNNNGASKPTTQYESRIPSRTKERLNKSNEIDETSIDESEDEESDQKDSSHVPLEESNEIQEIDYTPLKKSARTNNGYDSATASKSRTDAYLDLLSDDTEASVEENEEFDKDYQIFWKLLGESENNTKADLFQSADAVSLSSSESESDSLDGFDISLPYKRPNLPTISKQSSMGYTKEKDLSTSVDRIEKNHSVIQKTNIKKVDKNSTDESSDVDTHGKRNAKYLKVDQDDTVKYKKSEKGRRASRKGYHGTVEAILNSIISNEVIHEKECDDDCLPLKFRFDDSEDESCSQKTDESSEECLFQEMDFAFKCEEIGSYGTPKVKNQEKDDYNDNMDICETGENGHDIYLEEQMGLRCRLCGAVLLESRYVIPKLANYAPDKSKRNYFDEQFSGLENPNFQASDLKPPDFCKKTDGTVWELLPTTIRPHLYPHQQEGFEFLWKNLVGTIDLSRLHKLDQRGGGGGGGCIISHAPGTGKTLLTIVFIESFLKRFPECFPVIVAPASMLLTWEAEFKKWQFGFSFVNLNNLEIFTKEMMNGGSRPNKDMIRAMKISKWTSGNSVLGVSYNLYEKLAGNLNRDTYLEKMGSILLDRPNLVVLDEGHTPRNQDSNIWNALRKLKTKKRVILSGTPFQNNFEELFNTLQLVRPAMAPNIAKDKVFADMIHSKNRKIARSRSASEDIEKLKVIISPFVHVHKGHILESKLLGLKRSVISLNPHPLQKPLIKILGNLAKTLEYEHKLALVSLHPSLILNCLLSEKEEKSMNKHQLEKVRLQPNASAKTRFVMELIGLSVSLREKVLIFSQYIQPLELLKDQITLVFGWNVGKEVMVIKGEIQQKARQTIMDDFNDPHSKMKVLLASTKCCSEGINLIGASRVVLLDVVWNPSVERQAISRAYRLGQKKMVYTYHLMMAGTTEEEKYDRQVEKERLAAMVFSSASMAGGELKKVNVDDKILQQMVDHKELKDMFKEIRYPENQTRI